MLQSSLSKFGRGKTPCEARETHESNKVDSFRTMLLRRIQLSLSQVDPLWETTARAHPTHQKGSALLVRHNNSPVTIVCP